MRLALALAALAVAGACAAAPALPAKSPAKSVAIAAGERAFQKCYACHSTELGRNDLAGPSLYGIVGRPVAAVPGFDFSDALRRFAASHPVWSRELIGRYAADPEALVPGTSMAFHGMEDEQEREALLKYLEALGS